MWIFLRENKRVCTARSSLRAFVFSLLEENWCYRWFRLYSLVALRQTERYTQTIRALYRACFRRPKWPLENTFFIADATLERVMRHTKKTRFPYAEFLRFDAILLQLPSALSLCDVSCRCRPGAIKFTSNGCLCEGTTSTK